MKDRSDDSVRAPQLGTAGLGSATLRVSRTTARVHMSMVPNRILSQPQRSSRRKPSRTAGNGCGHAPPARLGLHPRCPGPRFVSLLAHESGPERAFGGVLIVGAAPEAQLFHSPLAAACHRLRVVKLQSGVRLAALA